MGESSNWHGFKKNEANETSTAQTLNGTISLVSEAKSNRIAHHASKKSVAWPSKKAIFWVTSQDNKTTRRNPSVCGGIVVRCPQLFALSSERSNYVSPTSSPISRFGIPSDSCFITDGLSGKGKLENLCLYSLFRGAIENEWNCNSFPLS